MKEYKKFTYLIVIFVLSCLLSMLSGFLIARGLDAESIKDDKTIIDDSMVGVQEEPKHISEEYSSVQFDINSPEHSSGHISYTAVLNVENTESFLKYKPLGEFNSFYDLGIAFNQYTGIIEEVIKVDKMLSEVKTGGDDLSYLTLCGTNKDNDINCCLLVAVDNTQQIEYSAVIDFTNEYRTKDILESIRELVGLNLDYNDLLLFKENIESKLNTIGDYTLTIEDLDSKVALALTFVDTGEESQWVLDCLRIISESAYVE